MILRSLPITDFSPLSEALEVLVRDWSVLDSAAGLRITMKTPVRVRQTTPQCSHGGVGIVSGLVRRADQPPYRAILKLK